MNSYFLTVNNTKQCVTENGNIERPDIVFIYVHGGPGFANSNVLNRFSNKLVNMLPNSLFIFWDQRAAGRSFKIRDLFHQLTINVLKKDLNEISKIYMRKYPLSKIALIGHSSGTIICLSEVIENHELYDYYFGIAQVINGNESEKELYDEIVSYNGDNHKILEIVKIIQNIDYPPSKSVDILTYLSNTRRYLSYNMGVSGNLPVDFGVEGIFKNTIYKIAFAISLIRLWGDCLKTRFDVKHGYKLTDITFISGADDKICPYKYVDKYLSIHTDGRLEQVTIANTGHRVHLERSDEVIKIIIRKVTGEMYAAG